MQKALFEPGTPVFIYRLFQFATVGLLILLIVLYTQGKFIFIIHFRINRIIIIMNKSTNIIYFYIYICNYRSWKSTRVYLRWINSLFIRISNLDCF